MIGPRAAGCPEPGDLQLWSLGLVDPLVGDGWEEHARTCAACKEALAAFARREAEMPSTPAAIGHVPEWALVRWHRLRGEARPATVRAVEAHLAGCDECRTDLERHQRLRSTPVADEIRTDALDASAEELERWLEPEEDWEPVLAGATAERGEMSAMFRRVSRAPERARVGGPGRFLAGVAEPSAPADARRRPSRVLPWLGGYAALATAAAIVFALRDPITQSPPPAPPSAIPAPAPAPEIVPPAPGPTPAPAPIPETGRTLAGPAWRVAVIPRGGRTLVPRTRSAALHNVFRRDEGNGLIVGNIEVQLLDVAPDAMATVEILGDSGKSLARTRIRLSELEGSSTIAIASASGRFPSGSYVLRVSAPNVEGRSEMIEYPIEIKDSD